MVKAVWNGVVVAESTDTVVVDGVHYFRREALTPGCFESSEHTAESPRWGTANYLHVVANGERAKNAAWHYEWPPDGADEVRGRIAFTAPVSVED